MSKIFYVATSRSEEDGVEWPTTNFNKEELQTIQRFLKEFNSYVTNITVDAVVIINDKLGEDDE